MIYEIMFLKALGFTIVIELVILVVIVRYFYKIKKKEISNGLLIFAGTASFATLPYVWFIFPAFIKEYNLYLIVAEISVLFLEAIFYYFVLKIGFLKSFFLSLVCNTASFVLGIVVLYRWIG